jgi:hypothetical protein
MVLILAGTLLAGSMNPTMYIMAHFIPGGGASMVVVVVVDLVVVMIIPIFGPEISPPPRHGGLS